MNQSLNNLNRMIKVEVMADSKEACDRLKVQLAKQSDWKDLIGIRDSATKLTVVDSSIVIAIVAALGTGLGSLISGLLQLAKQSAEKKIVVQTENGTRLEVPVDISTDDLDKVIDKINRIEKERIKIIMP